MKQSVRHERQNFSIDHNVMVDDKEFPAITNNLECMVDLGHHKLRVCLATCENPLETTPEAIRGVLDLLNLEAGQYVKGMVITPDMINKHLLAKKFPGITLEESKEK